MKKKIKKRKKKRKNVKTVVYLSEYLKYNAQCVAWLGRIWAHIFRHILTVLSSERSAWWQANCSVSSRERRCVSKHSIYLLLNFYWFLHTLSRRRWSLWYPYCETAITSCRRYSYENILCQAGLALLHFSLFPLQNRQHKWNKLSARKRVGIISMFIQTSKQKNQPLMFSSHGLQQSLKFALKYSC